MTQRFLSAKFFSTTRTTCRGSTNLARTRSRGRRTGQRRHLALRWRTLSISTAGPMSLPCTASPAPISRMSRPADLLVAECHSAVSLVVTVLFFTWLHARRLTPVSLIRWLAAEPLGLVCAANIGVIAVARGFLLCILAFGLHAFRL